MQSFNVGFVKPKPDSGGAPKLSGDNANVASEVSGTTLKLTPPFGQYDGVNAKVTITDADFVTGNIKNGVDLFGLVGTLTEPQYTAGNNLLAKLYVSAPTENNTWTTNTSYTVGSAILSFTPSYSGTYRFSFNLRTSDVAQTAYARLYDSVLGFVGAERSTNSATGVDFTEDISVVGGRTITMYIKIGGGSGVSVTVYTFRCSVNQLSPFTGAHFK